MRTTTTRDSIKRLEYTFVDALPFSLDLEDSDFTQNQVILDGLVGTLVKNGTTGAAEPYLAESWTTANNGLTYIFKLHKGLTCSDGYPLTASNFVRSITARLASYAKRTHALEFEKLAGWKDFVATGDRAKLGIQSDDEKRTVTFTFVRKPDSLLEFLIMPYFGFYSPANYAFPQTHHFSLISCGPFRLQNANESEVTIERRPNWPLHADGNIQTIHFSHSLKIPENVSQPTIVDSKLTEGPAPAGYFKVQGTPIMLVYVVLSPSLPFFRDVKARQWFAKRIRAMAPGFSEGLDSALATSTFFQDPPRRAESVDPKAPPFSEHKLTVFVSKRLPNSLRMKLIEALHSLGARAGIDVELTDPDMADPEIRRKLYTNGLVDVRAGYVSVNPYFYPSVFRMMFCSTMGVSFPDPSGRVCKLVEKFEKDDFAKEMDYRRKLTSIVEQDATVIPIARIRLQWLYSNRFDRDSIMPISNYPPLELLKVK